MALPELPWNSLDQFVKDYTKGLQEIVDIFAPDPGADNSMFAMDPLYEFDAAVYLNGKVRYVTSDYNDGDHYNGNQGLCYAARITLMNNTLHILSPEFQGQVPSINWHVYTLEQLEDIREKASDFTLEILNAYPDENIEVHANNNGYVYFQPGHYEYTNIKIGYNEVSTPQQTAFLFCFNISSLNESADGKYIEGSQNCGTLSTGFVTLNSYLYVPVLAVIKNNSEASDFVTYLSNYNSHNAVVDNGTWKIYYGDHYIVFSIPQNVLLSYNDIAEKLNIATAAINGWNPGNPPIVVPTYQENKHRDDPDPDADIEVDMPLSDAAFGAGLSHYYVTTVGSTVLNDISAAMSTWDIKNTGKDLYRNLLSCRITKVGPIPSESSTFVIYGEELQYNGSPITITKITGNPSMDLGEYEILPKFHDFRDYAPFTKIEMFIPYCGWVSLPSHCMSSEDDPKIITGTLLCDIIAGTCKAVIKCNDTVVAEASGFTAIDVPFTGENVGMKMAGIANSITSYGNQAAKTVGSVASGGMAGGAGAGAALAGGLVGMVGSYAQMYSAFNANYTEICGKTGDGCNVAGLGKVYIKIQRPKTGGTEAPYYVPANYAHTTGFMAMKQKQISECNDLIVCANVDTSGISGATARERAEIKRLLETGIYVNLPEPEPPEP